MRQGKTSRGLRRAFTPGLAVTLYYYARFSAKVSHKSEIDISSNISFGKGCVVGSFVKIKASEGALQIGDRGGIATGCFISAGASGITIGNNFICGPHVNIVGQNYIHNEKGRHLEDLGVSSKGISIGDNVWIGAGSTVTDGAVIGNNTIVVANSLVNGRYPDDVILQGSPAKVIFRR
jgi:acetyltransferase-like isoleucine patch superfamily enzyme